MAFRVSLTARAARNLRKLYRHIEAESSAQANAWFIALENALFSLREYPSRCPVTPEDAELRHLLYGAKPNVYRIIFMLDEPSQSVIVMQIRHGARRPIKARQAP